MSPRACRAGSGQMAGKYLLIRELAAGFERGGWRMCRAPEDNRTRFGGFPTPEVFVNGCDIAWMLVATALVLVMTPALGFFYAGLVRSKNTLNTLMMSVASLGFVGLAWAIGGYSIAFAPGSWLLGGTGFALLRGVGLEAHGTIPHLLFMAFQATFAI